MTAAEVITSLKLYANPEKAIILARFFKTGPGEYGEGDKFMGVMVPTQRQLARQYRTLPLSEIKRLLTSAWHEVRLTALIILTERVKKISSEEDKEIFDFYLAHTIYINNWDLVDLSAPQIVGRYLLTRDRSILYKLAQSSLLWERRISILATLTFIRQGDFEDTLQLAELLLLDSEDLMHKAVGWMLREVGKRDLKKLTTFLDQHYRTMPRTMLRYAIERLSETQRQQYLRKN